VNDLPALSIRRIGPVDATALHAFYDGLSAGSKRLFRPLGEQTTLERCCSVAVANLPDHDTQYDLVASLDGMIVGWAFLWRRDGCAVEATLGLGVSDQWQGRGLGRRLLEVVLGVASGRGLARIVLTVVQDNTVAQHLYESVGFVGAGEFVGVGDGLPYFCMTKTLGASDDRIS